MSGECATVEFPKALGPQNQINCLKLKTTCFADSTKLLTRLQMYSDSDCLSQGRVQPFEAKYKRYPNVPSPRGPKIEYKPMDSN